MKVSIKSNMPYTSHSEPFALLKDKLREESHNFRASQTLRYAQGDSLRKFLKGTYNGNIRI
jgi:hypothetical protein